MMYEEITNHLCQAYNAQAAERDTRKLESWKIEERNEFLKYATGNGRRLLELGSGPGVDALFFKEQGFEVRCLDLSPQMVALCRAKGLEAYPFNFLIGGLPENEFDAVFSRNALLHIPKSSIRLKLRQISQSLREKGLFYLGLYGGFDDERIWEDDYLEPKRFFSYFSDLVLLNLVAEFFEVLYFRKIKLDKNSPLHYQSIISMKMKL